METALQPGNWKAVTPTNASTFRNIIHIPTGKEVATVWNNDNKTDEVAALIAAAPKLLHCVADALSNLRKVMPPAMLQNFEEALNEAVPNSVIFE